ncbi:pirin family protein [Halopseudomonas salegens]|uniref:Quercetin 2,3-dioxygenase n=1 Tax=Halopseudomonas salegens TaxID=1434072 RepID=A0A1H2EIK9_9GAMM|nr:pirin family protein [Halopseudomonas salegens]SDT94982.1 hypothetical protein SAMN05216210_0765 [Halopseudomonas salegens]
MTVQTRNLVEKLIGRPASDGDGVKLTRVFGGQGPERFDPFLMLDEFGSDSAADYIGGFPAHPHRGFETVTYMLEGRMLHEDHLGNQGLLESGGVQWMTAGRGIIHSEMPQQTSGRMRGFQLWINLPAAEKMQPAHYQDLPADAVASGTLPGGGSVKVIAGTLNLSGKPLQGPIQGKSTEPLYLDLHLNAEETLSLPLPTEHTAMLYVYEGDVRIDGSQGSTILQPKQLGRLSQGNQLTLQAGVTGSRALLIAGKPIGEPIIQYGPFVMNSRQEIEQAIMDYQSGRLAS